MTEATKRIWSDACQNLSEPELLDLMIALRGWVISATDDSEVKGALGA